MVLAVYVPPIAKKLRWMGHPGLCSSYREETVDGASDVRPTHREETAMDRAPGLMGRFLFACGLCGGFAVGFGGFPGLFEGASGVFVGLARKLIGSQSTLAVRGGGCGVRVGG
jgi:hypothetical protein